MEEVHLSAVTCLANGRKGQIRCANKRDYSILASVCSSAQHQRTVTFAAVQPSPPLLTPCLPPNLPSCHLPSSMTGPPSPSLTSNRSRIWTSTPTPPRSILPSLQISSSSRKGSSRMPSSARCASVRRSQNRFSHPFPTCDSFSRPEPATRPST